VGAGCGCCAGRGGGRCRKSLFGDCMVFRAKVRRMACIAPTPRVSEQKRLTSFLHLSKNKSALKAARPDGSWEAGKGGHDWHLGS
jgi:hypothetical protein